MWLWILWYTGAKVVYNRYTTFTRDIQSTQFSDAFNFYSYCWLYSALHSALYIIFHLFCQIIAVSLFLVMTLRTSHLSVDFFLIVNWDFTSQSTRQNFHYASKAIIIVRCCIIPLDHLTYSSNIYTDMEVIKLMYPYYSSSLVSENPTFPFTLQVTTSELTELYSAAMVWSIFNNISMFISAPPTAMTIVSPKQTIAPLRHPENQKPASFYCHDENHTLWMCFFHLARACLFILKFPPNQCPNHVLLEAKTS